MRKKVHFEIVEYASTSLLSGRASEALKLIHFNEECILHVDLTSDESPTQEKILHNYRDVFTGLGKLPGTYHIDMHPNAIPVQENPRRVPIPVKDELKSKIEELETMGVTAKVAKPQHEDAFVSIQELITQAPVLRYFDVSKEVII